MSKPPAPSDHSAMLSDSDETGSPRDPLAYPEGGLAAWTTVAGSWFILFCTFGYLYSFGVYQDYYTIAYLSEYTTSKIAWIGSFQLMMPFFLGVVSGKLFDEGYFRAVVSLGSLIFVFSLFMLSLAQPHQYYQVFLSQGVGMGIGIGLTFVPAVSINSHYFRRRRGLATGIALSGASTGAVIFPIMLNHLFSTLGFAGAVRATAYIVLGFLIFGNALARTRLPGRRARARLMKGNLDGEYALEDSLSKDNPRNEQAKQVSDIDGPPPDIKVILRDVPYLITTLAGIVATFGFYFPFIYIQLFAADHNVNPTLAFYVLPILNASSILGRVIGNHMSDLYGPFNILGPVNVAIGALILAFLGINDAASIIVVSVLVGIFSGAWLALAFSTLGSLARSQSEVGIRTGLALALSSIGCLVSSPVQGALLRSTYVWKRPIVFSATLMFIAGGLILVVRMMLARKRGTWRV